MGTLCQTEKMSRAFFSKAKTPGQNNHEDGEELEISPKCTSGAMWTTEELITLCHLVLLNNFHIQNFERQASVYKGAEGNGLHESSHAYNSSFMLVRINVIVIILQLLLCLISQAKNQNLLNRNLLNWNLLNIWKVLKSLDLITSSLLGNVTTECFFLDCYGRIFDWNSINSLLFINKKKKSECHTYQLQIQ